ncbi:MAG: transposase [Castellaniella sp.]
MQRLQAFKYELMPNGAQQRDMRRFARRADFPRFKKKGQGDGFRYPDPKQIKLDQANSRIGNARRDYLHKTSTTISQNHAMVCIKDLQVRNMSRSAAGTADAPGRNVRAKSGLNKSILDQGWFEFRRQLDYKLAWSGDYLVVVPAQNTSRTCPCCGHVSAENRQTQARFACVECGFEENADVVGAINILRAGHARFACEVSGAVMPPAAGTHRSDSFRLDAGVSAVGIPRL